MSGWESYIYQIQNRYDPTTQEYTLTNCCTGAALYGQEGTPWAATQGFTLSEYEFEVEQEDGSKKKVKVNEFQTAFEASKGNRKPSEAGIRMNNKKFMFLTHQPDNNSVYLAQQGGGGACVCRSKTALVIGIWDKAAEMSNKKLQNPGDCNELVEKMGAFLSESGY